MKLCEYCGQELPNEALECTSCGAKEFKSRCENCGEVFEGNRCPKCKAEIGGEGKTCPGWGRKSSGRFCPQCGSDLNGGPAHQMRDEDAALNDMIDSVFSQMDQVFRQADIQNSGDVQVHFRRTSVSPVNVATTRVYEGDFSSGQRRKGVPAAVIGFGIAAVIGVLCYLAGYPAKGESASASDAPSIIVAQEGDTDRSRVWEDYQDISGGGWKEDETGWWYETSDGNYFTSGFQKIGGKVYCFDSYGYMVTGWVEEENGELLYFQEDGSLAKNTWVDEGTYYMTESGRMARNALARSDQDGMYYAVGEDGRHLPDEDFKITTK